jgi:SAM-dependent methyltransferase
MSNASLGATGNFGNLAADYEQGRREYPPALLERVVGHLAKPQESLVLDVGCGTGKATRLLAPSVRLVIGVDPDPQCLHMALERGGNNLAYRRATAEDLPFTDAYFDAVTTFSSFHWWCRIPGVLTSIHRVLRSGGCFLVVNKHDAGPFRQEARALIARYSPHELPDAKQGYEPQTLLQAEGYWEVTTQELLHEERFTLPELLCQIRSLAVWNCVPEARRAEATQALESHFASQLDTGIFRRPLLIRIVAARKNH